MPLYFAAAQTLINGSKQYYPFSMVEEVREEPIISLYYYNPLVLKVLKTILEDPNCKWHVEDDQTVACFYPVDKPDPSLLSDTVTLREDTGEKENVLIILEEKANEEWARMQAALILSQIDPFNANQWTVILDVDDIQANNSMKRVILAGSFESDCWLPTDDKWNISMQKLSDLAKSLPDTKFVGFGVGAGLLA